MFTPWLLRNLVAPVWCFGRRSPMLAVARRLEQESRTLSPEERRERQLRQLRAIVDQAWSHSQFYRERLQGVGFQPGDLRSLEDLPKLPLLTKADVRENARRMISRGYPARRLTKNSTSGSTGIPLEFWADRRCMDVRWGVTIQRDRWAGWDFGESRSTLKGVPPQPKRIRTQLRYALLERPLFLDTLRLSEESMRAYARVVLRERPTLLFGHGHSLYLLARFWEESGQPPYAFRGVVSVGMPLALEERQGVERTFATQVFDRYGCEELGIIATECEAQDGLHVATDALVVEVVPDGGGDSTGRVVITDLLNRGMPFLRYDLADRAAITDRVCPCGRTYPLLAKVLGRVAANLYTPGGAMVEGIALTESFSEVGRTVHQLQVVQDRLDHLTIRVVPSRDFGDVGRTSIAAVVRERFGEEVRHDLELVERIPPDKSGKYRFTICALPEEDRRRLSSWVLVPKPAR